MYVERAGGESGGSKIRERENFLGLIQNYEPEHLNA